MEKKKISKPDFETGLDELEYLWCQHVKQLR